MVRRNGDDICTGVGASRVARSEDLADGAADGVSKERRGPREHRRQRCPTAGKRRGGTHPRSIRAVAQSGAA